VEKIPAAIVEAQSVAVDAVSGATMTSDAILAAVTDALTKAGVDLAQYSEKKEAAPVEKAEVVELTADVAVIGGGARGPRGGRAGQPERRDRGRGGKDVQGRRQ
jgi:fumarate reductase flavoprotein subunit